VENISSSLSWTVRPAEYLAKHQAGTVRVERTTKKGMEVEWIPTLADPFLISVDALFQRVVGLHCAVMDGVHIVATVISAAGNALSATIRLVPLLGWCVAEKRTWSLVGSELKLAAKTALVALLTLVVAPFTPKGVVFLHQKFGLLPKPASVVKSRVYGETLPSPKKEAIEAFVKKFLAPYIAGEITRSKDAADRKPMMEQLYQKVPSVNAHQRARIQEYALHQFIDEAARGLHVRLKASQELAVTPLTVEILANALKEALPREFPGLVLSDKEILRQAHFAILRSNEALVSS